MTPASLRGFIRALPKTETHLHVEGALDYGLLHGMDPRRYAPPPAPFHAPDYRFESFPKFDEILLGHALRWFVSADRYHEAARVLFARHVSENVRYVETSFHLRVCEFCSIPPREIIRAIKAAAPPGLEVRVFAGMLRTDYEGAFAGVIDAAVDWDELDGVDLHGFEQEPTQAWTAPVWRRFRDAGKVTKCHAGEFDGAHRVREAISDLGVRRIQHGVRAVEDPEVLALAASEGAVFDVCPISNVRLKVSPSIAAHPLRRLLRAGVACTISTDDPLVFGNTLTDEYVALAEEGGFSPAELAGFARTGFVVASIDAGARDRWTAEINRVLAAFSSSPD